MKQLSFELHKPKAIFGGALLKGNPKTKRPLSSKLPVHLVLRANQSTLRTNKNFKITADEVERTAKKYGVKIYDWVNVGNHIHLLIRITKLRLWAAFIRELTGRIAQQTGVQWKFRPFTRIISGWRRAYKTAREYINLNRLEVHGFINRKDTRNLKELREIFDG